MTGENSNQSEDELQQMIKNMTSVFEQQIGNLRNYFDKRFDSFEEKLEKILPRIEAVEERCKSNETEIINLKAVVENLEKRMVAQEANLLAKGAALNELNTIVDEQTNRSLRNTLVFRGIKQTKDEINWDDCRSTFINKISSLGLNNISHEDLNYNIERIHRGKPSKFNDKNLPLPIFVKFVNWSFSDRLRRDIIHHKFNNVDKIFVDQVYSPALTARRTDALKLRRSLLQLDANKNKTIFLNFPAKLMIKDKGSNNRSAELHKSF